MACRRWSWRWRCAPAKSGPGRTATSSGASCSNYIIFPPRTLSIVDVTSSRTERAQKATARSRSTLLLCLWVLALGKCFYLAKNEIGSSDKLSLESPSPLLRAPQPPDRPTGNSSHHSQVQNRMDCSTEGNPKPKFEWLQKIS